MPASFGTLFLLSFSLAVFFVVGIKKIALKYHILIVRGIPLTGGIGMALAFSVTVLCYFCGSPKSLLASEFWGIVLASVILLAAGVVDDVRELSVVQKFLIQSVAAFLLILSGVKTNIVHIGTALNFLFSFLWIIGITNAVNLLDVMDGLAATVCLPILLCFSVISYFNNDVTTLVLSLTLAGAILGFLVYNVPPAKVYMGNSGSHFFGLLLAAIALTARYAPSGKEIALFAPFLILGFPIFDTIFLILMRIKKGKSAFNKSNDHLALRYLKQGHSKMKTLTLMLVLSVFFVVCGFSLNRVSNLAAVVVLSVAILFSLLLTKKMSSVDI